MDDDVTPIICFLLLEQKKLLSLRLQSMEVNNETIYDIKPDMSWCISAIAAAAVVVTRPKYISNSLLLFLSFIFVQ